MSDGARPGDGPSIRNVIRHVFKFHSDRDGGGGCVWCVLCGRVLTNTMAKLESHFAACTGAPNGPSETTTFRCGPCDVATKSFSHWKHFHVNSEPHRIRCRAYRGTLYTVKCRFCETVLYGTETWIGAHMRSKHEQPSQRSCRYPRSFDTPLLSTFMAYVQAVHETARPAGYKGPGVYYCDACKGWNEGRALHASDCAAASGAGGTGPRPDTFYCGPCRVTFVCGESTYRRHMWSVEHTVLEADDRARNVDVAEQSSWEVSKIVLRQIGAKADGRLPTMVCDACERSVRTDDLSVLEHFETCTGHQSVARHGPPSADVTPDDYDTFVCNPCGETAFLASTWKRHVLSKRHLTTCRDMRNYAHYECAECRTLFFGTYVRIAEGHVALHPIRRTAVSDLMNYVFGELNAFAAAADPTATVTFFYRQSTGTFGRCDPSTEPASVPFYCATCRLEFYGAPNAYRLHAITVEHLILLRLDLARPVSAEPPLPESPAAATTVSKPATATPTTSEPIANKPAAAEPFAHKPAAAGPFTHKPAAADLFAHTLATARPSPLKIDFIRPVVPSSATAVKHVVSKPNVTMFTTVTEPKGNASRSVSDTGDVVDEVYGRYVTARLKAIQDRVLKSNIKTAIDSLLDSNVR